MSTKHTLKNNELEAAFSSMAGTTGDDTAALVLNHLELSRHAIEWLMQRETSERAGDRYSHNKPHEGRFSRWGINRGSVAVGGQKLRVEVPRIRDNESQTTHTPEIYARLQQMAEPPVHIIRALMLGLGTRKYHETAETLMASMGLSKSSLSEKFVEHSSEILEEFLKRRLDDDTYVAMFIDGKALQNQSMVIAIGVTQNGVKRTLGLTQATTGSRWHG
ncbi:MAG: transposase [Ignavibacteria bacterium]|nr:transposase [Ignavibacteria bacterium]